MAGQAGDPVSANGGRQLSDKNIFQLLLAGAWV